MAPHRKPRPARTRAGARTPALATAALTSVALLSQTANAAPSSDGKPSLEEVEKKVGDLYRQAESATENYNVAEERTTKQKKRVATSLDDVARRAARRDQAQEQLGSFASAPYRTRAASPDAESILLADNPRDYPDRTRLTGRLTERQQGLVDDYITQQAETARKRLEAAESLKTLTESQSTLKATKAKVQAKLTKARQLWSELAAEEKARLTAVEKEQREEAERQAGELARQQAAAAEQQARQQAAAAEQQARQQAAQEQVAGSTAPVEARVEDFIYAAKAAKALTFARSQIGKPCVWGATGPDAYDCSGFTKAAWKAAGVDLPRTTYNQVDAGPTVSPINARPGDLIFFHGDLSHVGLYIGNGLVIHAPKPGTYVREESVFYDGEGSIHSVVRPA
jgi:cell wall-associated NlpC family hydrolase